MSAGRRTESKVLWEYAKTNGFVIVSKDSDFSDRSLLFGHPPKVIRLHLGNCTTMAVETCLRSHRDSIAAFENDPRRAASTRPLARGRSPSGIRH
ncbi:MAG TPA: DUF5615 family PIN-like protein [Verrucomicrobiae bacterium]|nr:DUF5615 family PIN-like protein [Verrucomicrobiae bacterium]